MTLAETRVADTVSDVSLPEGWAWATVEQLRAQDGPIVYGILKPGPDIPDGIPYVRPTEIVSGEIQVPALRRTSVAIAEQYRRSSLKGGDILLTIVGTIGKVAVVPPELDGANITQCSARVRLDARTTDSNYFRQALASPGLWAQIEEMRFGSGVTRLNIGHVRELRIPLAPLAEQKRIAAKVEAVLAKVNAARQRLAKVPAILRRFRQSVLAAACSGRLTEDWRDNHGNTQEHSAKELVRSLESAHTSLGSGHGGKAADPSEDVHTLAEADIPTSWEISELQLLCTPGRPITYGILKPGPQQTAGVRYVRVADFPKDRLNLSTIRKTTEQIANAYQRSALREGDVLLSIRGTVGRVCRVPSELAGANITQDTARISLHEGVCADFVVMCLKSPSAQERMKGATKGVAVRGINIGDVRVLQIPIAPLPEQLEIVRRVSALFALADKLEARLAAATAAVERVTQAVLAKAFRGELVETEASLARREGHDYEPATKLLEKIKADGMAALRHKPNGRRSKGV